MQLAEQLLEGAVIITLRGFRAWCHLLQGHIECGNDLQASKQTGDHTNTWPGRQGAGVGDDSVLPSWRALSSIDQSFGPRLLKSLLVIYVEEMAPGKLRNIKLPLQARCTQLEPSASPGFEMAVRQHDDANEDQVVLKQVAHALLVLQAEGVLQVGILAMEILAALKIAHGMTRNALLLVAVHVLECVSIVERGASGNEVDDGTGPIPTEMEPLFAYVAYCAHASGDRDLVERLIVVSSSALSAITVGA